MRSQRSVRTSDHTPSKTAAKKMVKAPAVRWQLATTADHDAIVARSLALFREDPGTRPVTTTRVRRTLMILEAEPARGVAVVAVAGRGVVGYALLVSLLSNELGGEVCTVDEFYVDEGWRGAGVGTALMTTLKAGRIRRFRGAVALELEVTPRNRRARALYERLGFSPRKNATMRLLRK